MQERHKNRKQYFLEQGITTKKYVIPYIEEVKAVNENTRVLEIGCGEGGNLPPFIEIGCEVIGVDLNKPQLENAKKFTAEAYPDAKATFLHQNIYETTTDQIGSFDIIMLRDVIEHIPDQEKFMGHLKTFMKPDGIVFFGFPPWYMPFGGHQQVCRSKLSVVPYFHLLPKGMYKGILKMAGETDNRIHDLLDIKDTGISTSRFERIVKKNKFVFLKKTFFMINPNYEVKFGLKQRTQFGVIKAIPYLRDFLTTCMYCVIKMED